MKSEISFLKRKLYDLKLYSRKNCLVFSGIPEPKDGKENIDQIALNIIYKYILAGTNYTPLDEFAICNFHRLDPKPQPGMRVFPIETLLWNSIDIQIEPECSTTKETLKSFNNNPSKSHKIFINEALTKRRPNLYAKLRKDRVIHSFWIFKCKLFAKTTEHDRKILINKARLKKNYVCPNPTH